MVSSNRNYYVVLVLLLLLKKGSCCPDGWTIYRNSCYHVSRDSQNWFNAMKICEIHDSYIIHIDDADEQGFITHLLQSSSANNTWLGATDWTVEGSWQWEPHGQKLNYTNFAPGQPNNYHSQNCLVMDRLHRYQWNDLECLSLTRHYICERGENSGIIFG
ncbi:perlucin-like protein [Saccostrea echinata]|uniref:perlucin-like protein n=1 Tax=Saccostrea echinata TaxID=191078 RepID=UPI002A809A8E|nr:perlucin-like protein [Saccostrea echinata]